MTRAATSYQLWYPHWLRPGPSVLQGWQASWRLVSTPRFRRNCAEQGEAPTPAQHTLTPCEGSPPSTLHTPLCHPHPCSAQLSPRSSLKEATFSLQTFSFGDILFGRGDRLGARPAVLRLLVNTKGRERHNLVSPASATNQRYNPLQGWVLQSETLPAPTPPQGQCSLETEPHVHFSQQS